MRQSIVQLAAVATAVFVGAAAFVPGVAGEWSAPQPNAKFDYQIGGDYPLPAGVTVVSRDWFLGEAPPSGYGICYVNAFQTQADEEGIDRPDEQSNWPRDLVLTELGDDPSWGGEYLIDISTPEKLQAAADWVEPMIETCATKGFKGVEFDNLDSWTRFDGTPLADDVPFEKAEAVAYAALLAGLAHANGLAAAQKNAGRFGSTIAWSTRSRLVRRCQILICPMTLGLTMNRRAGLSRSRREGRQPSSDSPFRHSACTWVSLERTSTTTSRSSSRRG